MNYDDVTEAVFNLDFTELSRTQEPLILEKFLYSIHGAASDGIVEGITEADFQLAIDKVEYHNPIKANHFQAVLLSLYYCNVNYGNGVVDSKLEEFRKSIELGIASGCVEMYKLASGFDFYNELRRKAENSKIKKCTCLFEPCSSAVIEEKKILDKIKKLGF